METSVHYRSSFQQKHHLKDHPSFSSYLRPEPPKAPPPQEDVGCVADDSDQISVFDAENYFRESNVHKEIINKRVSSSQPVSVINLDGPTDQRSEFSTVSRLSSVSSVDGYGNGRNYRAHSFHATPTASSEASWNSQTGLLSNPPGSIAVSLRNLPVPDNQKKGGRSSSATKWFRGRKCPCSGKKSVQVEENISITRIPHSQKSESNRSVIQSQFCWNPIDRSVAEKQSVKSQKSSITQDMVERAEKEVPNLRRFSSENHFASNTAHHHHHHHRRPFNDGTGFSFPILNQSSKIILKGTPTPPNPMEDPPRDSLEVFQPPDESVSGKSMAVQQRSLASHAAGTVDSDRRVFAFPASPMSRITAATDDDVASDASSDLFEIESLSTQPPPSYPMYCRRDSLDEAATFNARRLAANCRHRSLDEPAMPSIATTECYEPSEASIDWSVTTAEGFDRGSVTNLSISASDMEDLAIIGRGGGGGGDGSKRKSGNYGLLSSCRCEKAVSVGPPRPVNCMEQEGRRAVVGGWRHVGGGGESTSSRPQAHNKDVNKPPLGRSRSARLSLAFAT